MDIEDFYSSLRPFTFVYIFGNLIIAIVCMTKLVHPVYFLLFSDKTLLQVTLTSHGDT
jgi:hypothetical protein